MLFIRLLLYVVIQKLSIFIHYLNFSVTDSKSRRAMCNNQDCLIRHSPEVRQKFLLRSLIQCTGGFIQNQDRTLRKDCSGNRNSLHLSFRKAAAPLSQKRIYAIFQCAAPAPAVGPAAWLRDHQRPQSAGWCRSSAGCPEVHKQIIPSMRA